MLGPVTASSGTLQDPPSMLAQARAAVLGLGGESGYRKATQGMVSPIQRFDSVASAVADPQGLYDLD